MILLTIVKAGCLSPLWRKLHMDPHPLPLSLHPPRWVCHCRPTRSNPPKPYFPKHRSGLACQGSGRRESAEEYFRLSLRLDPLMWVNMQSLCELGADLDVEKHFEEAFFKKASAAAAAAAPAADSAAAAAAFTPAAPARAGFNRFRLPGAGAAAPGKTGGRPSAQQKASSSSPPPPLGIWAGSGGGRRPPWAPYMAFGRGLADRCPGGCQKGDAGE